MVVLRYQFKQPGDGFTRKTMSLPIPNHRSIVEYNSPLTKEIETIPVKAYNNNNYDLRSIDTTTTEEYHCSE